METHVCDIGRLALLPSRSTLSDLGLIVDLFEKMLLNWSSFCLKSDFCPKKSEKSDFYSFGIPQKAKKYLKISLNMEYFKIKVYLLNVKISL